MPKLIDYPRTSYAGAWEVSDVVDDTGGKCALETCARKLNRKVSGSFKAIVGSAVKFGLLTSKREMLTTTTLFRRIKHAYDKQEELLFHREAFLTPPLFTQLCRKFRSRELPIQMLDIMLIREFDVEEINSQSVAKAFIDGARMIGLLDERNMVADIDQLAAQQPPRRELASPELSTNSFRAEVARTNAQNATTAITGPANAETLFSTATGSVPPPKPALSSPQTKTEADDNHQSAPLEGPDAIASLFGLSDKDSAIVAKGKNPPSTLIENRQMPSAAIAETVAAPDIVPIVPSPPAKLASLAPAASTSSVVPPSGGFRIELSGPGLNTILDVQDEEDLALARFLLDKIGRQLKK